MIQIPKPDWVNDEKMYSSWKQFCDIHIFSVLLQKLIHTTSNNLEVPERVLYEAANECTFTMYSFVVASYAMYHLDTESETLDSYKPLVGKEIYSKLCSSYFKCNSNPNSKSYFDLCRQACQVRDEAKSDLSKALQDYSEEYLGFRNT